MTEVIGIKFEETGTIEYVVPDRNYAKDDFVVVLDKKDKRLAQVVVENTSNRTFRRKPLLNIMTRSVARLPTVCPSYGSLQRRTI